MKNIKQYFRNRYILLFRIYLILICNCCLGQSDTITILTFDFDDHEIKEANNKVTPKSVGVSLTYDRFGNKESAVQLAGTNSSYLNLGVSDFYKSNNISISLWVKINNRVYAGKGYDAIPILTIKNGPGYDFINAIAIGYNLHAQHLSANSTKDSLQEIILMDNDTLIFNKWYHLVVECNNNYFAFYVDGRLAGENEKNFETKFLRSDSLMIGHTASIKNERYMRGVVDDIKIFHRALNQKEIEELYYAPNPNEEKKLLNVIFKFVLVVLGLIILIIILVIRNRYSLKKQKEELELANHVSELELKVVKAQMNPHFISNSLAAIQSLNYHQDTEKAGLYIAKFSFFLRQILKYSDENYISIAQEIEMIKLFVELEQLRFKNGFIFKLHIDKMINCEEVMMPALITQPFIENAIWHGLLPLKNSKEPNLTIRFGLHNNFPLIEIEDNGVGRDIEKQKRLESKGLKLVMDKIETLNKLSKTSNYKINITDLIDNKANKLGTKVIIYLNTYNE